MKKINPISKSKLSNQFCKHFQYCSSASHIIPLPVLQVHTPLDCLEPDPLLIPNFLPYGVSFSELFCLHSLLSGCPGRGAWLHPFVQAKNARYTQGSVARISKTVQLMGGIKLDPQSQFPSWLWSISSKPYSVLSITVSTPLLVFSPISDFPQWERRNPRMEYTKVAHTEYTRRTMLGVEQLIMTAGQRAACSASVSLTVSVPVVLCQ